MYRFVPNRANMSFIMVHKVGLGNLIKNTSSMVLAKRYRKFIFFKVHISLNFSIFVYLHMVISCLQKYFPQAAFTFYAIM